MDGVRVGESMIRSYGISMIGTQHIREGTVCQDAHRIVVIDDETVVAAVADGVGSEKYSQIASSMAVEVVTDYLEKNFNHSLDVESVSKLLCQSFWKALLSIEEKAIENEHDIHEYDTTLSVAILEGDRLFYGHSGDGGILAFTMDGKICKVTEQQRDGRYVIPLAFGEKEWDFGLFDDHVSCVMLATDGMYELFVPELLKNEENSVYTNLARFFMDPDNLKMDVDNDEHITEKVKRLIEYRIREKENMDLDYEKDYEKADNGEQNEKDDIAEDFTVSKNETKKINEENAWIIETKNYDHFFFDINTYA